MSARDNYKKILEKVRDLSISAGRSPEDVQVVAVSKSQKREEIDDIYRAGCRDFGENKVQEALPKMIDSPDNLRWHFIGNLQTKKVAKIIGKFHLIHSVDTPKLARKISEVGVKEGINSQILLEVNTSGETSKLGGSPENWLPALDDIFSLSNVKILGLMTMAPLTEDKKVIRHCFRRLREFRDRLEQSYSYSLPHLSMGMTNDYAIAIEEGATLLRIGTAIFNWH